MTQPFLSQVTMMAFNFPPRGWAQCDGQIMSISQNAALFSLLGTTYGGNGTSTFALPNLQSCVPIHAGAGFNFGQSGGAENVALNAAQLPQHQHALQAVNAPGTSQKGFNHMLAQSAGTGNSSAYLSGNANTTALASSSIQSAGGGLGHSNIQPYLTVNFCIATSGIFPSRN